MTSLLGCAVRIGSLKKEVLDSPRVRDQECTTRAGKKPRVAAHGSPEAHATPRLSL